MTERQDTGDQNTGGRDRELGNALRGLAMPPEGTEFWSDLHLRLLASAEDDAAPRRSSVSESMIQNPFHRKQIQGMSTKTANHPQLVDATRDPERRDRPSWMIGIAASVLLIAGVVGYEVLLNQDDSVVLIGTADETASGSETMTAVPTTDVPAPVAPIIDEAVLGGLTYPSDWDLETGAIQLADGRWEGEPDDGAGSTFPVVTLTDHIVDGSEGASAIAVLAGDGGGSGTFYELYLITTQADGSFHVSQPVDLGDRIAFTTLTFNGASVVAIYTDGFGDSHDRRFSVVDGELG